MSIECTEPTPTSTTSGRTATASPVGRWLTVVAGLSAAAFVAYPALRPYSSETGLAGARAFASDRWLWAHLLGMLGFGGLAAVALLLAAPVAVRVGLAAAAGLVLPYYGAEAFGLHALGRTALERRMPSLTAAAGTMRNNPMALTLFGAGLILLAVAGVALGLVLRRGGATAAGALIALGTVTYLPQFFGPAWLRIVHGAVLGAGLLLVAVRGPGRITG